MVISIDLSTILQFSFISITFIVTSVLYFKEGKKLNSEYMMLVMMSFLSGYAIYIGVLWILKPLGFIVDKTVFDSMLYNMLMGALLIIYTLISLKKNIHRKTDEKDV